MTLDFYDQRGEEFFKRTVDIDLSHIWRPFLALLPAGGHILDAGCGSGRETKIFLEHGYRVTAFDGSETMARLASAYTGQPVLHLTFDQMTFDSEFDGIWACATLLHIPRADLAGVFENFIRALKPGGIWHMSFKWGTGEFCNENDRWFTNFDDATFRAFLAQFPALSLVEVRQLVDQAPYSTGTLWLNALVRRTA